MRGWSSVRLAKLTTTYRVLHLPASLECPRCHVDQEADGNDLRVGQWPEGRPGQVEEIIAPR